MAVLEYDKRGHTVVMTLNRPERLNALSDELYQSLATAWTEFNADDDAWLAIVTGNGRGFCAGADLKERSETGRMAGDTPAAASTFWNAFRESKPTIVAVNGVAAGGGNELVVACDLAIAGESATFGQTGPRVGSSPVFGGANFLTHSVGEKRAKEIAFLCRRYRAQEAKEIGLINAVVPDDQLEDEVTRWAGELLALSPRYLEITKVSSNTLWNQHRDAYVHGMALLTQAIGSYDMIEGATAFVEKRTPRFEGRDGWQNSGEARDGDGRADDAVGDPAPTRLRT